MSLNRYRPHLVVLPEDDAYRQLMNGVKLAPSVNALCIEVHKPLRGWEKVLGAMTDWAPSLDRFPEMHLLLLIDFDNDFTTRYQRFVEQSRQIGCFDRTFLLGIDHREAEDLKRAQRNSFESLGKSLVEGCPDRTSPLWNEAHLGCNRPEIERMLSMGVLKWMFVS